MERCSRSRALWPHPGPCAAVQAVHSGDIIELADGVFQGPDNRDIDFLAKAIVAHSQSGN